MKLEPHRVRHDTCVPEGSPGAAPDSAEVFTEPWSNGEGRTLSADEGG